MASARKTVNGEDIANLRINKKLIDQVAREIMDGEIPLTTTATKIVHYALAEFVKRRITDREFPENKAYVIPPGYELCQSDKILKLEDSWIAELELIADTESGETWKNIAFDTIKLDVLKARRNRLGL